jgi:hypothetical protein
MKKTFGLNRFGDASKFYEGSCKEQSESSKFKNRVDHAVCFENQGRRAALVLSKMSQQVCEGTGCV